MKRILGTGAHGYIGTSFARYLQQWPKKYQSDMISLRTDEWRNYSFVGYDAVFHAAGIVHQKETNKNAALYYEINRDLTIDVARKAKNSGVQQFIFLSSMSVYGIDSGVITKTTLPAPKTNYGRSKWEAELGLIKLQDENFKVSILRPPMVYGKGSKGNYPLLAKIAQILPVFPYVENERSVLYIDNLCEFVRLIIENCEQGIFYPQNSEYGNTAELVELIAQTHGKQIYLIKGLTPLLKFASFFVPAVNKAFGSLSYDKEISQYISPYQLIGTGHSIKHTEGSVD